VTAAELEVMTASAQEPLPQELEVPPQVVMAEAEVIRMAVVPPEVVTAMAPLVALEEALVPMIPMAAPAQLAALAPAVMTSMAWALAAPKTNNKEVMEVAVMVMIVRLDRLARKTPPLASSCRRLGPCSEVTSCSRRVPRKEETLVAMVAEMTTAVAMVGMTTTKCCRVYLTVVRGGGLSYTGSLEPMSSASPLILA